MSHRDLIRMLAAGVMLFAMILFYPGHGATAEEGGGKTVRCITVKLTVDTHPQGVHVLVGESKKNKEKQSVGLSPATIEYVAVLVESPGSKPVLGLLPAGSACPDPASVDTGELTDVVRYIYVDPGHTGYEPVKNKKKKLATVKEVTKALAAGDEAIEVEVKYTLKIPTGEDMAGWGGGGAP